MFKKGLIRVSLFVLLSGLLQFLMNIFSSLKYVINLLPSETYASIRIKYSVSGVDYYSNIVTFYAV